LLCETPEAVGFLGTAAHRKPVSKTMGSAYKAPFSGPKQVIEYLGRYTLKVAISNHHMQMQMNKA
jgi:hypothetical protein